LTRAKQQKRAGLLVHFLAVLIEFLSCVRLCVGIFIIKWIKYDNQIKNIKKHKKITKKICYTVVYNLCVCEMPFFLLLIECWLSNCKCIQVAIQKLARFWTFFWLNKNVRFFIILPPALSIDSHICVCCSFGGFSLYLNYIIHFCVWEKSCHFCPHSFIMHTED